MINVKCPNPNCAKRDRTLRLDEKFIGKRVKCIYCSFAFQVDAEQQPQPPILKAMTVPNSSDPAASMTPMINDRTGSQAAAPQAAGSSQTFGAGDTHSGSAMPTIVVPLSLPEPLELPAREPPPLPVRRKASGGGVRVESLVVSLMSATAIMVSLALILLKVRGLDDRAPTPQSPERERWGAITIESGGVRIIIVDGEHGDEPKFYPKLAASREWSVTKLQNPQEEARLKTILTDMNDLFIKYEVPKSRRLVAHTDKLLNAAPSEEIKGKYQRSIEAVVKETLNLKLKVIGAEREAEFGARGIIRSMKNRTKAIFLDLGGGSAKFGYFHSEKDFRPGSSDLGVNRAVNEIKDKAKAQGVSFSVAARLWKPKGSDAEIRELIAKTPQLRDGEHYHLLGGTCWAVSVLTKPDSFLPAPDDREANVDLTAADIAEARALAEQHTTIDELKAAVLTKVRGDGDLQHLEEELRRVGKDFPYERLLAGVTILKSYADECQLKNKKKVQFFTRSMHAWPLGFIAIEGKFEK